VFHSTSLKTFLLSLFGASTLSPVLVPVLVYAQSAQMTPDTQTTLNSFQPAAPTRLFELEKSTVLPVGSHRVSGNLQVGGLGINNVAGGLGGGIDLRADMGILPKLEAGVSINTLGAGGLNSFLTTIGAQGKYSLIQTRFNNMPIGFSGLAAGTLSATGGGIGSSGLNLAVPISLGLLPNLNLSFAPGLGFGIAAGGVNNGVFGSAIGLGLSPALGLGADWQVLPKLSAIADVNLANTGFGGSGNAGVRYGIGSNMVADVSLGYSLNAAQAINIGLIGVGGTYAF
jgi:hypothetical protein